MPSVFSLRRTMVEIGRRLYDRGLVVAAEGNLSARLADGAILVTPAGECKGRMAPEDLIIVDAGGKKKQGAREPSSELLMHLTALRARPDIGACVHAHPPYATAFAVAGIPLADCILPEVVTTLGSIPLTEYATPSTTAVGASIERHLDRFDAFLLKNHGVLTIGADLEDAFRKMETVERLAQIVHLARSLGTVDELTCHQVDELLALTKTLHSRFSGDETPVCGNCRVGAPPATVIP
ncbi:MAG TPA: class II aldolase/adducin family protein [Acidobacteriota bacterium]|nr:class II aldolase/adducin family protein [Acidobacteriota bacterium]